MITLNTPGARTLADARQWFIDGKGVYVTQSEGQAELHIRGMIVDTRPVADISISEAQAWAVEWLAAETEAMNADAERQLAETIAHQTENEISDAVAAVRADGAAKLAEAAKLAQLGTDPVTVTDRRGRMIARYASDPRHPAQRSLSLRRAGKRLSAWTQTDEDAYGRYVSDGFADTDGYYAPLDRAAWSYGR